MEIDMNEVPSPNQLTSDEAVAVEELLGGNYPKPKENNSLMEFFNKIFKTKDTTKAGNLTEEQEEAVLILKHTARYNRELGLTKVADFIDSLSEDVLATSLSRKGFFINSAVTSKKYVSTESTTKTSKEKKSRWNKQAS